jgi:hypothetical protein
VWGDMSSATTQQWPASISVSLIVIVFQNIASERCCHTADHELLESGAGVEGDHVPMRTLSVPGMRSF